MGQFVRAHNVQHSLRLRAIQLVMIEMQTGGGAESMQDLDQKLQILATMTSITEPGRRIGQVKLQQV